MELKEAIYGRRSVRSYDGRPISKEDLQEILEAGVMAPNASNFQPWYFVAIANPDKIQEVRDVMAQTAEILTPSLTDRFAKHPQVITDTKNFIRLLGNAPCCILAFFLKDDDEYKRKETEFVESVAAALENMLLTAYSKGISSCWMTGQIEAQMDKILHEKFAPDKGKMIAMVTLGYSDQTPKAPRRREGRYEIVM